MSPPNHKNQLSDMELDELRGKLVAIENGQTALLRSVDNLSSAMLGDRYGNPGLVNRVQQVEEKAERHEKRFIVWTAYIMCTGALFGFIAKFLHFI